MQYFTEPVFRDGRGAAVRHAVPRVEAEAGAQEELREVLAGQHVSTISIMWRTSRSPYQGGGLDCDNTLLASLNFIVGETGF